VDRNKFTSAKALTKIRELALSHIHDALPMGTAQEEYQAYMWVCGFEDYLSSQGYEIVKKDEIK
jgi:hypothetical protein